MTVYEESAEKILLDPLLTHLPLGEQRHWPLTTSSLGVIVIPTVKALI